MPQQQPVLGPTRIVSPTYKASVMGSGRKSQGGRQSALSYRSLSLSSSLPSRMLVRGDKSARGSQVKSKMLVHQYSDDLDRIFEEQEARDAMENDSDFSHESFQRKKRQMTRKMSQLRTLELTPTPMGTIDQRSVAEGSIAAAEEKSKSRSR